MGQDPTHVYFDLLRAILHFGGEDGTFYAGGNTTKIVGQFLDILNDPGKFIGLMLEKIQTAITDLIADVKKFVTEFFDKQKVEENTAGKNDKYKKSDGTIDQEAKDRDEAAAATKEAKGKNDCFEKNKNAALSRISEFLKIGT